MKTTLLAVGKKHDARLAGAIEDYTKRLNHYSPTAWKLVSAKLASSMSEQEIRTAETDVLMQNIQAQDIVLLLDERGQQLRSTQLAEQLQSYMNTGTKQVVLVIGGAYGVSETLTNRADFTLSLSELVFPHQLVRLILVEQLYRAHTILAGEKYHHV